MTQQPDIEMLTSVFGAVRFDPAFVEKVFAWRAPRQPARTDRQRACAECPVKDGMYAPYAELLKLLPPDRRAFYLDRWWCHTDTRFCCNGARDHAMSKED